ncbi:hypothetical protein ON010_g7519 [Phytophthora cinnamomi]|nr:hypothetical protein ON010_g7519 [Phytophthora cinnamomi]
MPRKGLRRAAQISTAHSREPLSTLFELPAKNAQRRDDPVPLASPHNWADVALHLSDDRASRASHTGYPRAAVSAAACFSPGRAVGVVLDAFDVASTTSVRQAAVPVVPRARASSTTAAR